MQLLVNPPQKDWADEVARNVLFLTLLLDEKFDINEDICWSIYFDVSIDSKCFDRICKQAIHLVSLSANISDWHDSKYGKFLTFVDEKSLHNVRVFWQHYHSLSKYSFQERSEFSARFMKDFRNIYQGTFDDKLSLTDSALSGRYSSQGLILLRNRSLPSGV